MYAFILSQHGRLFVLFYNFLESTDHITWKQMIKLNTVQIIKRSVWTRDAVLVIKFVKLVVCISILLDDSYSIFLIIYSFIMNVLLKKMQRNLSICFPDC